MDLSLDGRDWQLMYLLPSEWAWRKVWEESWEPRNTPPVGDWMPGTVPGDVVGDALDAGLIPNPYADLNSRMCEWVSERDWVYRKQFAAPADWAGRTIRLRFDGVDYACRIYVNGQFLGEHEGMFTPFEHDVSALLRCGAQNTLTVVVMHMPPVDAVQGQIGWTERARVWKSRFAYDWDWCTRLVPLGIWQSVTLIATEGAWIKDAWARPSLGEGDARVEVQVRLGVRNAPAGSGAGEALRVNLRLEDPAGQIIGEQQAAVPLDRLPAEAGAVFFVAAPELWWPNGMGAQPLYRVRVELLNRAGDVTDARSVPCGLRAIRAIPNDGAPDDALPYTLEVNGRRMYVKGWNWAPIDNLYGRPQAERYERWVTLAREAHCNLLRVWGGGLLEREQFYDLCDRYGILVWQEFPHSSSGVQNAPAEDDAYLDMLERQARQMIPQKRNHPSLAIWCGGNELMDDAWTPLTDQHRALGRLKSLVAQLDPGRLWLPTSSSGPVENADLKHAGTGKMHDVHGPWQYQGPEAHYAFYNGIDALYHSEFGVEGATNLRALKQFCSPEFRFPPDANNPVWLHHGAWWLHREKLEALFGPLGDIETFTLASQWMQAEGLRYAIEANRRRKWRCSGTSPWQFNEAFPNFACTNAIDFLGQPKPAYWWVRRGYEPAHISLKYDRLAWLPGQEWQAEVWVNHSPAAAAGCRWSALALTLAGEPLLRAGGPVDLPDNAAALVERLTLRAPDAPAAWLVLLALEDAQGRVVSRNEYVFSSAGEAPLRSLLSAPETALQAGARAGRLRIANRGAVPALFVQIEPAAGQWLSLEDDYFTLAPGETREMRVSGDGPVSVKAWNSPAKRVKLAS